MKIRIHHIIVCIVFIGYTACKKPFNATLTSSSVNFLAVDGAIISGDSTFITLSRSTGITDTTNFKPELKAIVQVENDQNFTYPLTEKGKGIYTLGVTNFDKARTYRLDIKTKDGKIYQSDFVSMKVTPPIDSIYFHQPDINTMLFYVDTHDPNNATRYYRWDYKEVWEYAAFAGGVDGYSYVNNTLVPRTPPIGTGYCYASANSNQILVGTSAQLANDVIIKQQIGSIVGQSQKIERIYNMQLHQYAITKEAFDYYQDLKTNTENLGSIFDAQPSTIPGNIHCISSPTDKVLGFINVSTVTSRVFFLRYNDIPLRNTNYYTIPSPIGGPYYYIGPPNEPNCVASGNGFGGTLLLEPAGTFTTRLEALVNGDATKYPVLIERMAYDTINGVIAPSGYIYYKRDCIDCRVINREGTSVTTVMPPYFPLY